MRHAVPLSSSLPKLVLIASATGIDANSLATTNLTFPQGMSAGNTIPLFAKITRNTGTITLLVCTIRLNAVSLKAIAAVTTALLGATANYLTIPLNSDLAAQAIPITSNYDVVVNTINGGASTIDVSIWGYQMS